ncbi:glycosyltransferase [Curtobacterium sp. 1310]|uniref:glycosyltransferase n=1 Tax=Curtobacterium sp. 1310 TaxID=2806570 RepID=UPI001AE4DFCB|nr:glycosyltransferase [Curtobacterium sp. 1310]MBP1301310.1 rhamnosyltransferase [Curtobacterium sp. 1310]
MTIDRRAVVVVTHNPSLRDLKRTVDTIRAAEALVILIDNSSPGADLDSVGADVIVQDGVNRGVGWAHNEGVRQAAESGRHIVMFLDQDSTIRTGVLRDLLLEASGKMRADASVCAVAPLLVDSSSGRPLLFRQGLLRTTLMEVPVPIDRPMEAPFLPTSGMVVLTERFWEVGAFREDFFIDHVDREWGMRAVEMGYRLLVLSSSRVEHELGDFTVNSKGRSGFFHSSTDRDYYLKRNTILMMRAGRGSRLWRLGELAFAVASTVKCYATDPTRASAMLNGLFDGMSGRGGKRETKQSKAVAL